MNEQNGNVQGNNTSKNQTTAASGTVQPAAQNGASMMNTAMNQPAAQNGASMNAAMNQPAGVNMDQQVAHTTTTGLSISDDIAQSLRAEPLNKRNEQAKNAIAHRMLWGQHEKMHNSITVNENGEMDFNDDVDEWF